VQWAKRLSTERVNAQRIETMLHVGTHIDSPMHFVSGGKDVASIPLERAPRLR
jgi:arylformamidase